MATHSSNFAWKIPWMEKPGRYSPWGCVSMGTQLSDFTFTTELPSTGSVFLAELRLRQYQCLISDLFPNKTYDLRYFRV